MKATLAISLLTFLAGFLVCKYHQKPEVRTEIKEVVKEVRVKDTVTVVETKKREERRPDGTVVIETDTRKDNHSVTNVRAVSTVELKPKLPDWSVGAYTNVNRDRFLLTVDRRVIGNVFVGVFTSYEPNRGELAMGIGLRYEF